MEQLCYNIRVAVVILSKEPLEKPKRKTIWDPIALLTRKTCDQCKWILQSDVVDFHMQSENVLCRKA